MSSSSLSRPIGLGVRAPSGAALRLRVWLHRAALDRRLAQSGDIEAGTDLAVRAEQLVAPGTRRRLAAGIDRIVDAADARRPGLSASAPLHSEAVQAVQPLLCALAIDLRAPRPVRARGVALAQRLLTDSASPLYAPHERDQLGSAIVEACQGLLEADGVR